MVPYYREAHKLYYTETGKQIHFLPQFCKNDQLYQKLLQIKVVENYSKFLYKKLSRYTRLPPLGVEVGDSKDGDILNIIL